MAELTSDFRFEAHSNTQVVDLGEGQTSKGGRGRPIERPGVPLAARRTVRPLLEGRLPASCRPGDA
jgi:hypothetical protein